MTSESEVLKLKDLTFMTDGELPKDLTVSYLRTSLS